MNKNSFSAVAQLIGLPTGVIKRMLSGAYQIESAASKDGRTEAFMRDFCSWMEQCVRKNNSDCVCIIIGMPSPGSFPQTALNELNSFVGKCNGVKQFYWGLSHDPNVSSMDITGIMNLNYAQPLDLQQQTNIIQSKCKHDILSAMMKGTTPSEVDMLYAAKWLEYNYASDGIMYKGVFELNDYLDWRRLEEGNESQQWLNSKVRPLIMTRKQNLRDGNAWDNRGNAMRKRETDKNAKLGYACLDTERFDRRVAFTVHGIMSMLHNPLHAMQVHGTFAEKDVLKSVDSYPYACINRNKLGDSDETTKAISDRYTIEQIELLKPNLIVCCDKKGGQNSMIALLNENGYDFHQTTVDPDLWVDDKRHILAIDSYTPSVYETDATFYNENVNKLNKFITVYPNFF